MTNVCAHVYVCTVCSEFTLANSVRIVASGSFGSVAQVTCAPGYFFQGTNYTCGGHAQAYKWLGNGVCQGERRCDISYEQCALIPLLD